MAFTLMLHINNADPVVGEVDELPATGDTMVMIKNVRRPDGKDVPNLAENVTTVYFPIDRLNFIEVLSAEDDEEIIGFVRE